MIKAQSRRYVLKSMELTPMQANTLLWLAEGKTQREIGIIYGITRETVEKHFRKAKHKLNGQTIGEVIAICFAKRIIKPKPEY